MNKKKIPWWLVVGGGMLAGLIMVACVALVFGLISPATGARWRFEPGGPFRAFRSNGEQIYFTATSQRGTPITSNLGMGMMGGRTCASCHGSDGRGGRVMSTFAAPDIRYETLTSEEMEHEEHEGEEEEHPPYTDETIKRAISRGLNPAGAPLDWPMPRWTMSHEDLDDLVEFLKALD
ncbi:MAG: c-type cytochrome [Anaerolineae bacterium]|jgi:mono/diheme cytochrome c family protein